jgi:hypothetical protein
MRHLFEDAIKAKCYGTHSHHLKLSPKPISKSQFMSKRENELSVNENNEGSHSLLSIIDCLLLTQTIDKSNPFYRYNCCSGCSEGHLELQIGSRSPNGIQGTQSSGRLPSPIHLHQANPLIERIKVQSIHTLFLSTKPRPACITTLLQPVHVRYWLVRSIHPEQPGIRKNLVVPHFYCG